LLKYIYNRARPAQIAPEIINEKNGTLLHSDSGNTPAYPSGHAIQCYYLAKILVRKFPAKTQAIMEIATKCANIRIMAGLHYPSDRDFGWWVVDHYLTDE
jgi:membrane-associated phospholipid phosphatase